MGKRLKTEANRATGTGKWEIKKSQYDRLHIQS